MLMHRVRVHATTPGGTHITIDDKLITGVTSIEFRQSVGEVPQITLTIMPEVTDLFEDFADVHLELTPSTVQGAAKTLRKALMDDSSLRKAFTSSIRSVLDEQWKDTESAGFKNRLAEKIAERIIGDDAAK